MQFDWWLFLKVLIAIPIGLMLTFMFFKMVFSAWFSAKLDFMKSVSNTIKSSAYAVRKSDDED